nr:hypothetical protein [Candidatus Reidiella endopervernicosa]
MSTASSASTHLRVTICAATIQTSIDNGKGRLRSFDADHACSTLDRVSSSHQRIDPSTRLGSSAPATLSFRVC